VCVCRRGGAVGRVSCVDGRTASRTRRTHRRKGWLRTVGSGLARLAISMVSELQVSSYVSRHSQRRRHPPSPSLSPRYLSRTQKGDDRTHATHRLDPFHLLLRVQILPLQVLLLILDVIFLNLWVREWLHCQQLWLRLTATRGMMEVLACCSLHHMCASTNRLSTKERRRLT
jgi:hypothetical protein